jgi:hypothetical protein
MIQPHSQKIQAVQKLAENKNSFLNSIRLKLHISQKKYNRAAFFRLRPCRGSQGLAFPRTKNRETLRGAHFRTFAPGAYIHCRAPLRPAAESGRATPE